MNILRDKRLTTKILILLELAADPLHKQKDLSEKLDMTVQAVSDYFKIMKEEGLVRKVKGAYRPTQKGILFLHSNFSSIRDFIDGQIRRLNIIDLCTAVARGPLRPGDRVGLFMESGELVAYKERSSTSMGIVVTEARKGEEVGVKELEGIVDLSLGEVRLLQVPSVQDGGSPSVDLRALAKAIEDFSPDRVAAIGAVAKVLLRRLGMECHIEYAVPTACIEACQKGLDVLVLAGEAGVHEVVNEVNAFNQTYEEKIRYTLDAPPLVGKRGRSRSTPSRRKARKGRRKGGGGKGR